MDKGFGGDFARDIKINRFKMAEECEEHSSLYQYYADLLADAKTEVDAKKDKLGIVEAKRELDIRKNDPPKGIPKVTDNVAKALVQADTDVVKQKEKLREAKSELYHLEAAVTSLEHRKRQLDNLVQLLIAGYYSAPKTERKPNTKETDRASAKVRDRLNKKNRG